MTSVSAPSQTGRPHPAIFSKTITEHVIALYLHVNRCFAGLVGIRPSRVDGYVFVRNAQRTVSARDRTHHRSV